MILKNELKQTLKGEKMKRLILAIALVISNAAFAQVLPVVPNEVTNLSESDNTPKAELTASCTLTRVTWDEQKDERVLEEFAPAKAYNVALPINFLTNGKLNGITIDYDVVTPEGKMEVNNSLFAMDTFGSYLELTVISTVSLPEKDMVVRSTGAFAEPLKYDSPNFGLNPVRGDGVSFSFGLKPDGTVKTVYGSNCEIKIKKLQK